MELIGNILASIGILTMTCKILLHWYIRGKINSGFFPALTGNHMPGEYFLKYKKDVPIELKGIKKACNFFFYVSRIFFVALFLLLVMKWLIF